MLNAIVIDCFWLYLYHSDLLSELLILLHKMICVYDQRLVIFVASLSRLATLRVAFLLHCVSTGQQID